MTRQGAWAARQRAAGLCQDCTEPQVAGSTGYCLTHLIRHRIIKRRTTGNRPWRPGGRGRPPIVAPYV